MDIFSVIFAFGPGFKFLGASREVSGSFKYSYWESPQYDIVNGSQYFLRLAYSTPAQLGFKPLPIPSMINGEILTVHKQIGEGTYSRVYQGVLGIQSVAIKVLKHNFLPTILEKEAKTLNNLSGCNAIPKFFAYEDRVLIMQLGTPLSVFDIPSLEQQSKILVALKFAHNNGYVHWDVRPKNELKTMLGDWGSAVHIGTPVPYVGTVHTASDEILKCLLTEINPTILPHPKHDLISFVRSVFCIRFPQHYEKLKQFSFSQVDDIINFWRPISSKIFWGSLHEFANTEKYEEIMEAISSLFFPE